MRRSSLCFPKKASSGEAALNSDQVAISSCWKRHAVWLERKPEAVGQERYRMVEADQRDQFQDLFDAEGRREIVPDLFREICRVVQLIDHSDQQALIVAPGGVIPTPVHRRT